MFLILLIRRCLLGLELVVHLLLVDFLDFMGVEATLESVRIHVEICAFRLVYLSSIFIASYWLLILLRDWLVIADLILVAVAFGSVMLLTI
jgi:hypothetical protein